MSRSEERRKSRQAAANKAREDRDTPVSGDSKFVEAFLVDAATLDSLGIGRYITPAPKKKGEIAIGQVDFVGVNDEDFDNGMDLIGFGLYFHTNIGVEEAKVLCPKYMKKYLEDKGAAVPDEIADGKCSICDEHDAQLQLFFDENDPDRKEQLQKIVGSLRPYSGKHTQKYPKAFLSWVVDAISEDSLDEGLKFWVMPPSIFNKGVVESTLDYKNKQENGDPGFIDILNEKTGLTFFFKNSGDEGGFDRYHGFRLMDREYDLDEAWLDAVPCWLQMLKFHTSEELSEMFTGAKTPSKNNEQSGGSTSEEKPRRRRTRQPEESEDTPDESEQQDIPDEDKVSDAVADVRKRTQESEGEEEKPRRRRRSKE